MSFVSVNTTQNVSLEYEIASVGERILANLLDQLVFLGWILLVSIIYEQLGLEFGPASLAILLLPVFLYHLVCEVFFNGQSVGKRTLKIRVLKRDGTPPSLGDYLMRWIFRIIECGIGMGSIALLTILINGKGQRLGDMAAGTAVVRTLRPPGPGLSHSKGTSPNYEISYPEAIMLSDKDISIIKRILKKSLRTGNQEMLIPLAEKVSKITGAQTGESPYHFLATMVNDYNYLVSRP